jgi:hypothetical protein
MTRRKHDPQIFGLGYTPIRMMFIPTPAIVHPFTIFSHAKTIKADNIIKTSFNLLKDIGLTSIDKDWS